MIQQPMASIRRLRWSAFALIAFAYMLSYFHRIAPAALAAELQRAFDASGAALGALAATYFYVYAVMQIPTGVLVDTVGPRRIVTCGGIAAGVGSIVFGTADGLAMAAAGRILVGLGVSVAFVSLLKVNAAWFHPREFATLTGLSLFMGCLGAVAAAAPLAWMITQTSWRNVFVGAGIMSMVVAVLSFFIVRDGPRDGSIHTVADGGSGLTQSSSHRSWSDELTGVIKNSRSWPGVFVGTGILGSFYTFVGLWAVPYLTDVHGMTQVSAANHTTTMLVAFAIGSLTCGSLSDRLGRRRGVLIGCAAVFTTCWLPLIWGFRMPSPLTYLLCFVMGFTASGATLIMAVAKELNPLPLAGMATSVANSGVFVGVGILQPLVGWVLDRGWLQVEARSVGLRILQDYRFGLTVLLMSSVIGLLGAWCVTETHCRNFAAGRTRPSVLSDSP